MEALLDGARRISRVMMECGGVLIVLVAFLITGEIVLRQVFNRSLPGIDEISGFALGVASTWTFAHGLLTKAHIRIDTVYERLPAWPRAFLDLIGLAALAGFVGTLVWHGWTMWRSSIAFGTTSQSAMATPIAIPQGLWLFGLGWFASVIALLAVVAARALARRDLESARRLIGTPSPADEIEAELGDAKARRTLGERAT